MRHGSRPLVVVAAMLACAPAFAADTLLDTYGPDQLADGLRWSLFDDITTGGTAAQSLAVRFDVLSATTVTGIQTSIAASGLIQLRIVEDSSGVPLGTIRFDTPLNNPVANTLLSGLHIALDPGRYWLAAVVTPTGSGNWTGGGSDSSQPWSFALDSINDNWTSAGTSDAPAARLFTSAVPEPAHWVLLLAGGAGLAGLRRARQQRG